MSGEFCQLRVLDTREEIGGLAKTVRFAIPEKLQEKFRWRAGQHLSFRFVIDGDELRRSYSISSSPAAGDPLQITVKRVKDGVVSNHIYDHVKADDLIDTMPPFGGFCLDTEEKLRRTHYFFGAGSGITPLYSLLHSVLAAEPYSAVHLLYGNKNSNSIIFLDRLRELKKTHHDRAVLSHVLSAPSAWSGFKYWRKGIVDANAISEFIAENPPYAQDAQYYICGPGQMNSAVRESLMALDVPATRIHMESYGGAVEYDDEETGMAATIKVSLRDATHTIAIRAGQTVLDAIRTADVQPPFSCQSGVCGACRATLTKGKVHMRARMALEDHEVDAGAILTCQSLALDEKLEIAY